MRRAPRSVRYRVSIRPPTAWCFTPRTSASAGLLLLRMSRSARRSTRKLWKLRIARQDGQCTYCAGRPDADSTRPIRQIRRQPSREGKLPICAEMCSTKSLLAGDGAIIAEIYKERVTQRGLRRGRMGLEDRPIRRASLSDSALRSLREQTIGEPWRMTMTTRLCPHSLLHRHHCVGNPDGDRGNTRDCAATRPGRRT